MSSNGSVVSSSHWLLEKSSSSARVDSLEVLLLSVLTLVGVGVNVLTMLCLLLIPSYRMKSSCFLFHHCLICLTLSLLIYPYSLSFTQKGIRCDYLGNLQVTCVTAQLLNMAAMVASEAYRFEDLIHQENSHRNRQQQQFHGVEKKRTEEGTAAAAVVSLSVSPSRSARRTENGNEFHPSSSSPPPPLTTTTTTTSRRDPHYFEYQYDQQTNQSTISCGCLSFGILIIWFSAIILHLGITMIGSESKSYYDKLGQLCNFIITDIRGYVLTLMWIIMTIFSLIITIRYIHKILREVSLKRRHHQPLLSLTILGQSHGQSIASRDVLMQQIQQRIQLNIVLIVLFILFWFPLFIVTLGDIKFKISETILRYLLIVAWSNSSISPLTYCLLFPKCNDLCSFRWTKDRSTTYDSLTSYYNRIGDRFHDISKWDQYQHNEPPPPPPPPSHHHQRNDREDDDDEEDEEEEEECPGRASSSVRPFVRVSENRVDLSSHGVRRSKENSLLVQEISSSSTSTQRHPNSTGSRSNGLIVTTTSKPASSSSRH